MTGNLPPGVEVHMIPGNRPEDEAEERFWADLYEKLDQEKVPVPDDVFDAHWFMRAIEIARDMGYAQADADARLEAELSRALEETERRA